MRAGCSPSPTRRFTRPRPADAAGHWRPVDLDRPPPSAALDALQMGKRLARAGPAPRRGAQRLHARVGLGFGAHEGGRERYRQGDGEGGELPPQACGLLSTGVALAARSLGSIPRYAGRGAPAGSGPSARGAQIRLATRGC